MAFQFNRNSGQKNGVVATVDSGQISKIREMGTMVTEVPNLTQGAMLSRSTPTNFSGVVPGNATLLVTMVNRIYFPKHQFELVAVVLQLSIKPRLVVRWLVTMAADHMT
jgi:hypothetical protein